MDLDIKNKKSAPKKGRRAGLGFNFTLSPREDDNQDEVENISGKLAEVPLTSAPVRGKKLGGWAEDTISKSDKKQRRLSGNLLEQERLLSANLVGDADSDEEIPVIPNLDDYADDELVSQIAKAPSVAVNRAATYKELETDLLKNPAFANFEDINLRVLTKYLYPPSAIQEPDTPWSQETLFAEVVSIINEEKHKECLEPVVT